MTSTLYALPHLRSVRTKSFLSQQELANAAGIARSTIIDIERGKVKARPGTLRKIAEALKCNPEQLIDETLG